jgi:hypothetical protein
MVAGEEIIALKSEWSVREFFTLIMNIDLSSPIQNTI